MARASTPSDLVPRRYLLGRYALFDEIARGGFASIHLGRAVGVGGFSRTVAIKRLHEIFASDPDVSTMFLDEARVVARIRHPNVVATLDLISEDAELFLVMEYVEGVSLHHLLRLARSRKRRLPLGVALRIMAGALHGLHAAHEARDEQGDPMNIIHRDVSPDNILVGADGMARLLDFGVARALGQYHTTKEGEVRGKLAYMTPEQIQGQNMTRRSDIYAASAVLWEMMTGQRLMRAKNIGSTALEVLNKDIKPPSEIADTPKKLDGIVLQGLERDPDNRWPNAEKMAAALEAVGDVASQRAVARYVRQAAGDRLGSREQKVRDVEAAVLDMTQLTQAVDQRTSIVDPTEAAGTGDVDRPTDVSATVDAVTPLAVPTTGASPRAIALATGGIAAAALVVWMLSGDSAAVLRSTLPAPPVVLAASAPPVPEPKPTPSASVSASSATPANSAKPTPAARPVKVAAPPAAPKRPFYGRK